MKEPEDLKIPGIIVVIGAIISAVTAYLMSGVYSGLFSAAAGEGMASVMGAFSALSAFFAFLILWWIIFAGIFYLLSMAFAGNGMFRRTLEFTGYGLVPVIVGLIISAIVSLYYIPLVEVPVISNIQDPAAVQRFMSDILTDPAFREFTRISAVISVIFL
ncbi:MAG TPA: Yip1 family protein, partial [Methanoregulaceae archaeon]|nr:Yip1 family protein [Methanoregulaceae archaeon]